MLSRLWFALAFLCALMVSVGSPSATVATGSTSDARGSISAVGIFASAEVSEHSGGQHRNKTSPRPLVLGHADQQAQACAPDLAVEPSDVGHRFRQGTPAVASDRWSSDPNPSLPASTDGLAPSQSARASAKDPRLAGAVIYGVQPHVVHTYYVVPRAAGGATTGNAVLVYNANCAPLNARLAAEELAGADGHAVRPPLFGPSRLRVVVECPAGSGDGRR